MALGLLQVKTTLLAANLVIAVLKLATHGLLLRRVIRPQAMLLPP